MEFGPRALGHRSILASPEDPYSAENLNTFIKHREGFRKFAASVPVGSGGGVFRSGTERAPSGDGGPREAAVQEAFRRSHPGKRPDPRPYGIEGR
jgi:hypothetical protein